MADLDHSLNFSKDLWLKNPQDICDKDLINEFSEIWKSPDTSDQMDVRYQMLLAEMNSRTAKRNFLASMIVALAAFLVSLIAAWPVIKNILC